MSELSIDALKARPDFHPDFYHAILQLSGGSGYVDTHIPRYLHTLHHMPIRSQFDCDFVNVLELGSTDIFPPILMKIFGFESVEVSCFSDSLEKEFVRDLPKGNGKVNGFNVDLESVPIPRPEGYYNMVLCFELIEHLERDPMFMISEIGRVLAPGGLLYLSTPNICSSRNVLKILEGYAPHFHMKYNRSRSLYRHNIEYSPGQVNALMLAGGFSPKKTWTADTFEEPSYLALELLAKNGYPVDIRGDNFYGIYEKVSGVVDRWPSDIYA